MTRQPTARRFPGGAVLGVAVLVAVGCGPRRVQPPRIDAVAAGRDAIVTYDADGDGALSPAELRQLPGVDAIRYDHDSDGQVSAAEIAARVRTWQDERIGLITFQCQVVLNGKPLEGATLRLVPEDFLGDQIKPASGTTGTAGVASVGMAKEHIRSDLRNMDLMHCGIYRVEITHPNVDIPSQYNSNTTLGHEVARDTAEMPYTVFVLRTQ